MYPTDSTTYIFVTHENWSDLYLVTQIVVVYTDADYDINFRYGYPVPGESFAIVNAGVTHDPTKTVDYVDYECHVYLNNVYLDTLLFAYHY